jgi:HEAT repeat protein
MRCTSVGLLTLTAALTVSVAVGGAVAGDTPGVTQLMEAGKYREAYDAVVQNGKPDPGSLGQLARTLLGTSMESDDSYQRWFALQAALPLTDRQLLDSVRARARANDRYERSLAMEILARTDPQGSREELLAGLESPYRPVRLRALDGLVKLNDRTLTERFGAILESDPDPDLRALAARALGTTGAAEAVPMLHRGLDDPMAAVQEEAVRALVVLRDPGISEVVRRRLADNAGDQRVRTLRLAGLVPDRALIRDLGPYLGDGDPEVRAFAAGAILSILEHTAAGKP